MKKSIVITGASTGIGHAAAKELIARGYRVFGSVRKAADGERLQRELGEAFTPLQFDVTDQAALQAAVAALRPSGLSSQLCSSLASSPPSISLRRSAYEVNENAPNL